MRLGFGFNAAHRLQDRLDYQFIPNRRVEHHVVKSAGRPVGIEVMFEKAMRSRSTLSTSPRLLSGIHHRR